ncbi:MAG TPA: hypothetical protein VFU15_09020 [Bacteroidia bacterium]|nr:hypothetical protein [Bacteroidia bacterium]
MKTLRIFTALFLLAGFLPLQAQDKNSNDSTDLIYKKIVRSVSVPDQLRNENVDLERVRVVFTIDEKGRAHVIDVNTKRPDIIASVTKQFEAIDFSGSTGTDGKTYSIWLNFKVV